MLEFAIIRDCYKNGQKLYTPVFVGEDGEFKRELTSRIRRILGPKKSFTESEITGAINSAFEEYKREFKEKTIKLP